MKLTLDDYNSLMFLIHAAQVGGIDSLIIEDGVARGVNESRSFVIISNHQLPKFPHKIGLGRLGALKQRLTLLGEAAIEALDNGRGEVSSLSISSGRSKVLYRCTGTALIKAPKQINDTHQYALFLNEPETALLLNGAKVMGGKTVTLSIKKGKVVTFTVNDESNDPFSTELETPAELLGTEGLASHHYHADVFIAALKAADTAGAGTTVLAIGENGTIWLTINGHQAIVMPKVNEDGDDE